MDIKRLNDNQIRCALTEAEIEEMGFCIDDIIGNGEMTQKFMRVVLEKVEEQEAIDVELLSPMVRAELLPDHSMAITFGGITEEEKKGMFGKILEMMNQMAGKAEPAVGSECPECMGCADKTAEVFEQNLERSDEVEVFSDATPLALVCIGAAFEDKKAIKLLNPTLVMSVIKLIIQPAIFLPIAVLMGFTGEKLVALIIMLGAPTTPSCFIMAKSMGYDGVLSSGAVVLTTIMSAFTITACLFVVRTLGFV